MSTLAEKIKGFFGSVGELFKKEAQKPIVTEPSLTTPAVMEKVPSPVRLPFAKEKTIPFGQEELIKIPLDIGFRLLEVIPKAVAQTIQNYRDIQSKGIAEPLSLPIDARRLGFDKPEIEGTGKRLLDKFNELNAIDPPKNQLGVWKNASLSSLMVAIPDSIDAFVAGNMAELGAKLFLKATKYDPILERSLSELGLPRDKAFSPADVITKTKDSLLASQTITDYSNSLKSGIYVSEKMTGEGIPLLNKFFRTIQDTARNLILPLEQWGMGFQVSPIAVAPGLPGFMQPKVGLTATPKIINQVNTLSKQGLNPAVIAKQLGITEPIVKSILGQATKVSESLAQEAKKYKSAEEFVGMQPKLFHGTTKRSALAIEKEGFKFDKGVAGAEQPITKALKGNVVFFSENPEVAKRFARTDFLVKPELVEITSSNLNIAKLSDIKESLTGLERINDLKSRGFDGLRTGTDDIAIWNINKIKTKQQLIDIYNQATKTPPKAPIPPTPPPTEIPEFKGEPTKDPVARLSELIKEAEPARKVIEQQYTAERSKRITQVEKFIEEQIDQVGGEEGYRAILGKLKGELIAPEAKIRFEPIKDKLTQSEIKDLFVRTWKHPYLDNWEKINAADGLTRLLSGDIPQPNQLVLLEEIYGTDLIKAILSKRVWGTKFLEGLMEIVNLPRALLATADMSAFLRQGVVFAPSQPKAWSKAVAETFKKFAFSQENFEQYFKDLQKDPLYSLMRKSKLSITDPSRIAGGLTGREEPFISRILQKIPIIGIPTRFAERSYVGFLNKLRVDIFKTWADELLSKGFSPTKDIEFFKSIAKIVNTFTGRGDLGKNLNRIAPFLNSIFFSPRLNAARFNVLFNPVWYARLSKGMRVKAITNFAKFVVAGVTTLGLIKIVGGDDVEVEVDLRSSDFGKIKIDDTRWDIWGGYQQFARSIVQVITGERKNTTTGEIISLTKDEYPFTTRKEVLLRFIEGKLAPIPSLVNELMSGAKTFTGEDMTTKSVIREKFIPMYIQDIADAYASGGLGNALGAGIPAFFGIGVQTFEGKQRTLPTPGMEGLPPMPGLPGIKNQLPPMPGIF